MSPSIPLVRLNQVLPFERFLRQVGTPVERLMGEAGLPIEALGEPAAVASAHVVYGFVERALRKEGLSDLGVRVGLATRTDALGRLGEPFGHGSSAASLHEALRTSFSHAGAESRRLRLWVEPGRELARLCYSGSLGLDHPGFAVVEQYMVALLVGMVREAAGAEWTPPEVHLRSQDGAPLERTPGLDGPRVRTGRPATAVLVPWAVLRLPLRGRQRPAGAGENLSLLNELPADFETALRSALRPYLREGSPSVGLAAQLASTSMRSLQRSLASTGQSYSRLVQELRLETALELMEREDVLLAEVAAEVGYSDPAHFTRAFSRWTGLSPTAYRQRELFASSG